MNIQNDGGYESENSAEQIDLEAVLQIAGGDVRLLHELLKGFLDEIPVLISQLNAAAARADSVQLQDAAHKLKGVLRYLQMKETCEQAASLEELPQTDEQWPEVRRVIAKVGDRANAAVKQLADFLNRSDEYS